MEEPNITEIKISESERFHERQTNEIPDEITSTTFNQDIENRPTFTEGTGSNEHVATKVKSISSQKEESNIIEVEINENEAFHEEQTNEIQKDVSVTKFRHDDKHMVPQETECNKHITTKEDTVDSSAGEEKEESNEKLKTVIENEYIDVNETGEISVIPVESITSLEEVQKKREELEPINVLHPDTTLIDVTQIEPDTESVETDYGIFGKDMYVFPSLMDVGLDAALYDSGVSTLMYDEVGIERYKDLCKELKIAPIAQFIESLHGNVVDLGFYGVNSLGVRAIAEALYLNRTVCTVNLKENWLTKYAAYYLGELLRENNTITCLNLSGCRIGPEGAAMLKEGLMLTQCLQELDLSWNQLGDEGFEALSAAIMENSTVKWLNLSNNELGMGTGTLMAAVMENNQTLTHIDVSHNKLYPKEGLKPFFTGMTRNKCVTSLNMSWNAMSTKFVGKLIRAYLMENDVIQHLDLSWNLFNEPGALMIKTGAANSKSLLTLKLGNNPLMPDAVNVFLKAFTGPVPSPLQELDFDNIWVKKEFLKTKENVEKIRDLKVRIGGVYSNYIIQGPNVKELLLARAKYEAQKPKVKKQKKNFGHFVLKLEDQMVKREKFMTMIKEEKLKISETLIMELMKNFQGPKKSVDLRALREYYLKLYPDTTPPPIKQQKKRGMKKGKKKATAQVEKDEVAAPVIRKKEVIEEPDKMKIDVKVASQLLGIYSSVLQHLPEESKTTV